MSATYNWAYRPGVVNKYGFTVAASADNLKPSNCCYVALFGNDATGNGSRQYPYKTIRSGQFNILASGVYRLASSVNVSCLIGDGDVIIDSVYANAWPQIDNGQIYNIYFRGSGAGMASRIGGNGTYIDVTFDGVSMANNIGNQNGIFTNCIFKNCTGFNIFSESSGAQITNCTFYNCRDVRFSVLSNTYSFQLTSCIFYNCNIWWSNQANNCGYCLFYQCNFRFNASLGTAPDVLYPSTPTGYTYYNTLSALQAAFIISFPNAINPFVSCILSDPLFNNAAIGDFSLAFNSPAKNVSYFGTYGGARSIGQSIKARGIESAGGFEFASAVNLVIADDSITLTNPAVDAQIDTKVIVNTLAREIANLPSFGFNADRNGQYIDSIADLDTVTKAAGDTLGIPIPHIVETAAIVYNGVTYQPGDRFTTTTGQTTFTTVASGVVREILEAPQRHTIMARFSNGGASVSAGTALTLGYYYYVVSGSITYNSIIYNVGTAFKAIDTNSFSGGGSLITAFSTETFQHYEPGIKPTSNNIGDSRTGLIIRGNGDPVYDRGGLGIKEFAINAKFIQIRYIIKVNNLKP